MRTWEIAVAAVLLVACLAVGLVMGDLWAPQPLIGVIRFDAEIDFNTANLLIDVLEAARQDNRIAAVVLEILSPGGYATSSESIFYTLLRLREEKPLVVVVDSLAASGGYYMAAAGNRIYAPASSFVGNVGTRGGRPSDPAIAADELTSGPYKLEGGSRFDQIHQLDTVAESFVRNVVNQRTHATMTPLKISAEEIAEARIYLGSEALGVGLVDAEGGRTEGILAAAELAGIQDYGVVDMLDYLGYRQPAPEPTQSMEATAYRLVANAPPGAVYMLDSRIPLPQIDAADRRWPGGSMRPATNGAPAVLPSWTQPRPAGR